MKKFVLAALALMTAACAVPPPVVRPQPPAATWRAVGLVVRGVAGASCSLQDVPGWTPTAVTNADGYLVWLTVTGGLRQTAIRCHAEGFVDYEAPAVLATDEDEDLPSIALTPTHVDPSGIPLELLAAIRGAMWTARGPLPFGPRPGSADNIIATDFWLDLTPDQQDDAAARLKLRGYTHVVLGPIVDSDGYHGLYTARDWRGANFDAFLDVVQYFWDHGLAPVIFIHPDNWTLEETQALTPLFTTPRAQRLMRIVVPAGWEPTRYGWSSCTWAEFGKWARATWPNAVIALHSVADTDAPAGTDARCNDDDHAWNPTGNAGAWARVAPYFHVWLVQTAGYFQDEQGRTYDRGAASWPAAYEAFLDRFAALFRLDGHGSYRDRFVNGYAGWPQFSAWGPHMGIIPCSAENASYPDTWWNWPESESQQIGDAAVKAGAQCYLDGGTLPPNPVTRR